MLHGWHVCPLTAIEPAAQAVHRDDPSELTLPASQGEQKGERSVPEKKPASHLTHNVRFSLLV